VADPRETIEEVSVMTTMNLQAMSFVDIIQREETMVATTGSILQHFNLAKKPAVTTVTWESMTKAMEKKAAITKKAMAKDLEKTPSVITEQTIAVMSGKAMEQTSAVILERITEAISEGTMGKDMEKSPAGIMEAISEGDMVADMKKSPAVTLEAISEGDMVTDMKKSPAVTLEVISEEALSKDMENMSGKALSKDMENMLEMKPEQMFLTISKDALKETLDIHIMKGKIMLATIKRMMAIK